jgi:hypothetical protein
MPVLNILHRYLALKEGSRPIVASDCSHDTAGYFGDANGGYEQMAKDQIQGT